MKYKSINNLTFVRLEKNEEVVGALFKFCQSKNIEAGFIWAIGSVKDAVLAHYNPNTKKYSEKKINKILEAASLQGVISKDRLHLHAVLGDEEMKTFGGHLVSAQVAATLEVVITKSEGALERYYDEDIGLHLLKF